MAIKPNAKASRCRRYVPSHPSSIHRGTKLRGDARQAERKLLDDCGRRRANPVRRESRLRAMGSTHARRVSERSGFRPRGAEPPLRGLRKGGVGGHPQAAQILSYRKNGVSVIEFLTEEYRGAQVSVPAGGLPGDVVSQSHTAGPRRVCAVGSRSPSQTRMPSEMGRHKRPDRPGPTASGADGVRRVFEATSSHRCPSTLLVLPPRSV